MGPVEQALFLLLRPLVKILIRNGVSTNTANELLNATFVSVAEEEFTLPNRKQSDSRISVITGLTRKQVAKYRKMQHVIGDEETQKRNRVERVITGWLRDEDFLDEKSDPLPLPLTGEVSFTTLVMRYAGDVPVRPVADELLRIGNIAMTENGAFRLTVRGYIPKPQSDSSLNLFGTQTADFLSTWDNNLAAKNRDDLRHQSQVSYNRIPVAQQQEFEQLCYRLGRRALEDLDRWLVAKQAPPGTQDTVRLGFGTYQFMGQNEESSDAQEKGNHQGDTG